MGQFWTWSKLQKMYWKCVFKEFWVSFIKKFWFKSLQVLVSITYWEKRGGILDRHFHIPIKMGKNYFLKASCEIWVSFSLTIISGSILLIIGKYFYKIKVSAQLPHRVQKSLCPWLPPPLPYLSFDRSLQPNKYIHKNGR